MYAAADIAAQRHTLAEMPRQTPAPIFLRFD